MTVNAALARLNIGGPGSHYASQYLQLFTRPAQAHSIPSYMDRKKSSEPLTFVPSLENYFYREGCGHLLLLAMAKNAKR